MAAVPIATGTNTADTRSGGTPEASRARYQYFTEAPMDRLRKAGFAAPFTGLEDGVARYVRDHLATADPYL